MIFLYQIQFNNLMSNKSISINNIPVNTSTNNISKYYNSKRLVIYDVNSWYSKRLTLVDDMSGGEPECIEVTYPTSLPLSLDYDIPS